MEIVSKLPKWPNMLKFAQMTSSRRLPNTKSQKFTHSLQVMIFLVLGKMSQCVYIFDTSNPYQSGCIRQNTLKFEKWLHFDVIS